jgi:hypothetical protein
MHLKAKETRSLKGHREVDDGTAKLIPSEEVLKKLMANGGKWQIDQMACKWRSQIEN